jgi:TonB family protein
MHTKDNFSALCDTPLGRTRRFAALGFRLLLIAQIGLLSSGCVYFNTFYLARKNFNQAESARKKDKRDKASGAELKGYQEAIRKCSKVLSESPNSSWVDDALFIIGKSYYYLGAYDKSERQFRDLLSSFPESKYADESRFFLGKARYQLENYTLAREIFGEYLEDSKSNEFRAEATYLMAEMARSDERFDEAIDFYNQFSARFKSDFRRPEVQFKIGELQFQKEQYAAAERSFALAADLTNDPKSRLNAKYEQGRALYALDSVAAGLTLFEKLRDEQKDSVYLGNILLRIAEGMNLQGEEREAILLYDDIAVNFAKRIESAEAYYRLGEIAQEQWGDLVTAKEMYLLASKEQRGDTWRAQALEKVSDISRVETYLASMASDTTEAAVTNRFLLAEMYRTDLGRPDSALAEYKVIVDQYASSEVAPRSLLAIGWLYESHYGDTAQAQSYYQQVIDKYPQSDAVQQALDLLDLEGAEPFALYPDKIYAMAEEQYFDLRDLDSARSLFSRLVDDYPQSRYVPQAEFAIARIDLERFIPDNKIIKPSVVAPVAADTTKVPSDSLGAPILTPPDSAQPAQLETQTDSSSSSPAIVDTLKPSPVPADTSAPLDISQLPAYVNPTDSLIRPSEILGRNRNRGTQDSVATSSVDSSAIASDSLAADSTAHQRVLDAITKGKSTQLVNGKSGAPGDTTVGKPLTAKDSLLATAKADATAGTPKATPSKDSTGQVTAPKPAAPSIPADTILVDSTMIWRFLKLAEKYAGTPIGDEAARLAQGESRPKPKPQQQQPQQPQDATATSKDTTAVIDSSFAEPLDTLTQARLEEMRLQEEYERWPLMEYKPTNEIEFKYPVDAAPSKFEGRVVVKIKIEFDGKVSDVQFLKGSKIASIDLEVDRVLRLTEFDPLRIDPLKIGNYFIYNYEIRLPEEYR